VESLSVVKLTGHDVSDPVLIETFASAVKQLTAPLVVVHGGGNEINQEERRVGIESRKINGIRVTTRQTLQIVERVLGEINGRLVRALRFSDVDAIGLSGVGIARAKKLKIENETESFTGEVESIDAITLSLLLENGFTPVLSPVCFGGDTNLNVNADQFASAVAVALSAPALILISDVAGVLKDQKLIPQLSIAQANALIKDGTIHSGMVAKVRAALEALKDGVPRVVITNMEGFCSGSGTAVVN
jgi:acetylglutamate kinase